MARELALADTAEKITVALGADGFAGDAHALLMMIYKDLTRPIDLRFHAAKAAIAYEKPRLAALDTPHSGEGPTLLELIEASHQLKQP